MGCDRLSVIGYTGNKSFNPRTHMGCDFHRFRLLGGDEVSIHAPTWGATFVKRVEHHKSRVSIHAPTWGATTTWGLWPGAWRFQSTHPHGVRPTTGRRTCSCGCFNPRTHMGCDVLVGRPCHSQKVSIHAPTWGATITAAASGNDTGVSIHAPTWGATPDNCITVSSIAFQSTHPHGVRRCRSRSR